ncbi:MAG TPA: GNAT family N-acetyltransferase [Chthonomonadales bacterium]|nr:GNAT family N-acetyltransferase [Chthonomonadales bacterium]
MSAILRRATAEDAAGVQSIYAPYCTGSVASFELQAPSVEEMARRLEAVTTRNPWLLLESDGRPAGYAYATIHRERAAYQWSVDTFVYIAQEYHARGAGTALYTTLIAILTLQGYYKAFAGITLPNPASIALHEKMRYLPVGIYRGVGYKNGEWRDVAWYQRKLREETPTPAAPMSIEEVRSMPEYEQAFEDGAALLRAR